MIYLSQTILSTNSELYIPEFATIVGSRMSSFTRGNVKTDIPSLVYTVLPVSDTDQNNRDETPINRVLNRSNSYSPLEGTNRIVKVRVFLIPSFAQMGEHVCTYGIPTTNRHVITQYANVTFKDREYAFYVETLPSIADNPNLPPLPQQAPRRQNNQQLGPAVRSGGEIRIIN